MAGVGNIRVAAGQREAAYDRYAAGLEYHRLRKARSLAVALEIAADANTLGMIETETGMNPIDALETVGETSGRQCARSEPTTEIEKCCRDG